MKFETIVDGKIESKGELGEMLVTGIDDNGDEINKIFLYAKWRTGGKEWWKNGKWI